MKILKLFYKTSKIIFYSCYNKILFKYYNITYPADIKINGKLYLRLNRNGSLELGSNLGLNNDFQGNVIGRQQPCIFSVGEGASLVIGDNVGMSGTAIICTKKIIIGDNVRIGGNSCIYDTDFHSLNYEERTAVPEITVNINKADVVIGNYVFIGAHSTILKGVTIGDNAIIGACSVITKDIPQDEIWAGNPAKFIKKIPTK